MRAFFLPVGSGQRFCVFHQPAPDVPCQGSILWAPPFAEELNKSRRMAAVQARRFAQRGLAVLLIDLFGCGDSSGDFSEANWEIWHEDMAAASAWLCSNARGPLHLWGLRLGALLALDFAKHSRHEFEKFILWQPVVNGETYLTQFLRLRIVNDMLISGSAKTNVQDLRRQLYAGSSLEVAGYTLAPTLAGAIDRLRLTELAAVGSDIHWIETISETGQPLSHATRATAERIKTIRLHLEAVAGESFWATQEITENIALVEATTQIFPTPAESSAVHCSSGIQ